MYGIGPNTHPHLDYEELLALPSKDMQDFTSRNEFRLRTRSARWGSIKRYCGACVL